MKSKPLTYFFAETPKRDKHICAEFSTITSTELCSFLSYNLPEWELILALYIHFESVPKHLLSLDVVVEMNIFFN